MIYSHHKNVQNNSLEKKIIINLFIHYLLKTNIEKYEGVQYFFLTQIWFSEYN